ncbi:MAG TPA: aromatic ring-hydroxylating dioxygenase subunit alpha [Candidatus Binataceae bacterium]|nr:aromatic ring-hydroxylating dioxygenase subunit alpha [Candidatus Binataceae bacterium]
MDSAFADDIRRRAAWEKEREQHPEGFPALPAIPAARYCDPAFFRLEREHVFGKTWLFVAHLDELPEPGDVLLLDQFPMPLLLIRGEDRKVRAFYNTCRHRGGPLIREPKAHVKTRLVCQYHSWSYDLEGRLRGVPDSKNFGNLDMTCLGLGAVNCDSWAGLIFINLDPGARPLRKFLAPIIKDVDGEIGDAAGSVQLRFVRKTATQQRGNWKLGVDANIETYHVNTVHKTSAAPAIDQNATTMWLLENGHSRMFIANRPGITPRSYISGFPKVSAVTGEGVYSYLIYPNTVLVIAPTMAFTTQTWPVAPGQMRYDVYYMMAQEMNDSNRPAYEGIMRATDRVLAEDLGNLPFMQDSFEAGTINTIPLNYQERRIYYLHEEIDRRIGDELVMPHLRVAPVLADFVEK